jgi:enoyl-CoA hydratase
VSEERVVVTRFEGVRLVELNRPDTGNCLDGPLHEALESVWPELLVDRGARAVVITGRGEHFCSGADPAWVKTVVEDPFDGPRAVLRDREIMNTLRAFPLPVVAAVNGAAVGLGASIAIHCDLLVMGETAYLSDPHVTIGLAAGDGGAAMLPALIPIMRAKQFLYLGEPIPAQVAVELGLAVETVPAADLVERALELGQRLAAQPPDALQATKRAINAHLGWVPAAADQAMMAEAFGLRSPEFREKIERRLRDLLE